MNDTPTRFAPANPTLTGQRTRSPILRRVAMVLAVLLAIGLAAWLLTPKGGQAPSGRFGANGPAPVVGAPARTGDMPIVLNGLGTVTPLATVTVKTQIDGKITRIAFTEGKDVAEGDFLAEIDPRPYQVALEQAEGALARDQALLANARVDLKRYQTLVAEDSIAEQQLATQKALVLQDEGTVKTDQAAVDSAKLNLVYCHVTAPVAGRLGLRQVDLGNYVTPGDTNGLVVITQLKPITVVFTLPEDSIPGLTRRLREGATLSVTAWDRSHTTKLATGSVLSIDNQIDTTTGTLKIKASFANDDEALFPNQFVNVDLLLDTQRNAVLIPQSAVQRGAPGTFVYVIDPQAGTAAVRTVTLGPGDATNIVVSKGLKPGESVVVDGADRLKDGGKVTVSAPTDGSITATPPAHEHRRQHKDNGGAGDQPPNSAPSPQ
jgi:multidrug efflux system membrane fusion protein